MQAVAFLNSGLSFYVVRRHTTQVHFSESRVLSFKIQQLHLCSAWNYGGNLHKITARHFVIYISMIIIY